MDIKKIGEYYTVKNKYLVSHDLTSCTCPDYLYRQKKFGTECKHIVAVRQFLQQDTITINTETDVLEFIEKYGEDTLTAMIKSGEVYEKKGKLILIK